MSPSPHPLLPARTALSCTQGGNVQTNPHGEDVCLIHKGRAACQRLFTHPAHVSPAHTQGRHSWKLQHRVRTQGNPGPGETGTPSRENNRCRWGQIRGALQDLPGGLVAKTPRSQCRGPGFHPWWNQVPRAATKSSRVTSEDAECKRKNEDPKGWH